MNVLRFLLWLAGAIVVHTVGVRLIPDFAVYFDVFLVLVLAWAFESSTLAALTVGLITGLTADAFSGGLYGLNGFANCLIGYAAAFTVANLAKMNTAGAALLYAVAALVQQIVLSALVIVLVPNGAPPPLVAVAVKIALTALVGVLVFRGRKRFIRAVGEWRRTRESQLRF